MTILANVARTRLNTPQHSSANVGFEAKLWLTADKLRHNIVADYTTTSKSKHMNLRKQKREQILDEKCSVLADTIAAIRPVYEKATPRQKALLETVIGAALWYIPKPASAWTGCISLGALKSFHPDSGMTKPTCSEEHVYPRKVTARALLNDQSLTAASLSVDYRKKYGRLHFITKEENKSVQPHQRIAVFSTPELAYEKAGIILITLTDSELTKVKKRNREIIEHHLNARLP